MTIKEIKANNGNLYLESIKEIPYNNSLLIVGRKIKFEKEKNNNIINILVDKGDIITIFNSYGKYPEVLDKKDIIEEIYITEQQVWRSDKLKRKKIKSYQEVLNYMMLLERESKINKILKKNGEIEYQ